MVLESGLDRVVIDARSDFYTQMLEEIETHEGQLQLPSGDEPAIVNVGDLATTLERLALSVEGEGNDRVQLFADAFACRRTSVAGERSREPLSLLARLACDAILADKPTELVMLLRALPDDRLRLGSDLTWPTALMERSLRAFLLLCRRAGGWADVEEASAEIGRLRTLQAEVERAYLETSEDATGAVVGLLARYNLARVVDIAASYVASGAPGDALTQIDRHRANVERLLEVESDIELLHTTELIAEASKALTRASIWFSTRMLGAHVREFVQGLAAQGAQAPLLELWPPQREALANGLLDPARRAVVAEMPTSAGKTLVAEFSIVQALALNPDWTVAYLVPTRALVNQVARRLRRDLAPLGHTVEAAVPVFELDPTESQLLDQPLDVLVTTPEKLDLLIRARHPVAASLSLVVADEAHNIGVDERGARLELLLATIKRERPDARFLLLTPFVPNADQLAAWLGDDARPSIRVDWRPSERVAAAAFVTKPRRQPHRVWLRTLPSAHRVDLDREVDLDLGAVSGPPPVGKRGVTVALATKLAVRGGVLVLLNSRARAEERAAELAALQPVTQGEELLDAVANLATSELGTEATLPDLLRRGVAFHHAGLAHELRYLIELLVDSGAVRTVCGTTTLAQGVNFPIASVVVESLSRPVTIDGRPAWRDLSFEEFWNIAGRAGRALRDRVGLVAFPVTSPSEIGDIRDFLRRDATELVSALTESLRSATGVAQHFDLRLVAQHPTIGVFLQYLTHALRVAGGILPADVEDLLRSSLVFHQVEATDRALADRLVTFARAFVGEAMGKSAGYLALADSTGFSLSSVDYLYAASRREHPGFSDPGFWQPGQLFGDDLSRLTEVVSVLKDVPELTLGRADQGRFDPRAVAGIVRDWVTGESVTAIGDRWFDHVPNTHERYRTAAHYLFSRLIGQMPWGIGALQHLMLGGDAPAEAAHVPFMVFYGVDSEDATRLRMAGVPRPLASGLVARWRADSPDATTFRDVRQWLNDLPVDAWRAGIAEGSPLTTTQSRLLWREIAGVGV